MGPHLPSRTPNRGSQLGSVTSDLNRDFDHIELTLRRPALRAEPIFWNDLPAGTGLQLQRGLISKVIAIARGVRRCRAAVPFHGRDFPQRPFLARAPIT